MQRNLEEVDNRVYSSSRAKEQPLGDLCADFRDKSDVFVPIEIIFPEISGDLLDRKNTPKAKVDFRFIKRTFSVELIYGSFSPILLYNNIRRVFGENPDNLKEFQRSFSDLVYSIEKYIYGDSGKNVSYLQMLELHDHGNIFKGTLCDHLLERNSDENCSICLFRLVFIKKIWKLE